MIRYAFDLYPRDDPLNGARLVRFSELQKAEYRAEANGTGAGQISLRGTSGDGDAIDPRGLQYIRVVEIDTDTIDGGTTSGFAELVVGGFFLDNGDFGALTERSTKLLTFGSAGTLSYLGRAQMWSRSYAFASDLPIHEDTWHLYAQPSISGGDFLGSILYRCILEALSFASPATEPDDRIETAIPFASASFGHFNNSGTDPWTVPSGEFKAQVGENLLSVVKRLMEAGLYIEMDPDTFFVNAWQNAPARDEGGRGQDKTGGAWGAGVIRFQAPTDGTIATGNIKSEARRGIGAFIERSVVLAGGQTVYAAESGAADIPWEGFYPTDVSDLDTLASVANAQLVARTDAGDTLRLRMKLGNDAAAGEYRPFGDYDLSAPNASPVVQVNDLVTVHTGAGQWDYNEETFPVAALTIALRPGGDWDAWADLGSTYTSIAERAFQARGVPIHSHPPYPPLCDPSVACQNLTAADLTAAPALNGDAEDAGGAQWSGGAYTTAHKYAGARSYFIASTTDGTIVYTFDPDQVFTAGVRYVIDMWSQIGVVGGIAAYLRFGVSGGDEEIVEPSYAQGPEVIGGDGATWASRRICWTPTADRTGVRFSYRHTMSPAGYIAIDNVTLYTTDADLLRGSESSAARCDHGHRHRDLTGRDEAEQHPATAVSYDPTASGMVATDVQAAIEEAAAGGVTDHGALLGLADDDHPFYVKVIDGGVETVQVHGNTGATELIDLGNGNSHAATLDADCTFTFAGATAAKECSFTLELTEDGTGGWTPTWPGSVVWPGGSAPAHDTTPGSVSIYVFRSRDGGGTWYGFQVGGGSASGDPADDTAVWMPLTSVAAGDPVLVWDADNSLIPTLVPV